MERFTNLIQAAAASQFSDLHITGGHPLVFRKNGIIKFDNRFVLSPREIDGLVLDLLNPYQLKMLRNRHSVDFALSVERVRIRINVFNTCRGLSIAIRLLSGKVPGLDELNLHPSVKDFCKFRSGLILICGPTGAGKSTTIAGIINQINQTMAAHVITLEDPIEYRFKSDKSFVEQRELGAHFPSYERGLLDVLREDPDVIVVSELRETEAMRLTLDAAESGHLVIATMHAANVLECLYRFCNSFPLDAHELVRYQLSTTMRVIMAQHLHFSETHGFRLPVLSILQSNTSVRSVIRDNKFSQLENMMQMQISQGMFTFDQYKTEYLDKKSKFVSPSLSVGPRQEAGNETYYESPLVSPEALEIPRKPRATAPGKKPSSDKGSGNASPHISAREKIRTTGKTEEKNLLFIENTGSLEDAIRGLEDLEKS